MVEPPLTLQAAGGTAQQPAWRGTAPHLEGLLQAALRGLSGSQSITYSQIL